MTAALVYPVHNAIDYVKRSFPQLLATTPTAVPIVIVDDYSHHEIGDYLHDYLDVVGAKVGDRPIFYIRNSRQQLFTRAVNRGMRIANRRYGAEVMVIVNTDCDLRQGWFDYLIKAINVYPKIAMIGYRDQPDMKAWKKTTYIQIKKPDYVTGHCIALRTKALEELGVFCETDTDGRGDPNLAMYKGQAHIGSERIWCHRAMDAGWQAFYCNAPVVFHEAGKSWNHDLGWLSRFNLQPLWEANDTLVATYDSSTNETPPLHCDHANEVPAVCSCSPTCYCRVRGNTCDNR